VRSHGDSADDDHFSLCNINIVEAQIKTPDCLTTAMGCDVRQLRSTVCCLGFTRSGIRSYRSAQMRVSRYQPFRN
ncbi:MAG: hypothetical protein ACKJSG_18815, partial [Lentisphaeria bacterium]